MPRKPPQPKRKCECGRNIQHGSPHDQCSVCRHKRRQVPPRRHSAQKGTSNLFPGHDARMAMYEARAAAGLPLFS